MRAGTAEPFERDTSLGLTSRKGCVAVAGARLPVVSLDFFMTVAMAWFGRNQYRRPHFSVAMLKQDTDVRQEKKKSEGLPSDGFMGPWPPRCALRCRNDRLRHRLSTRMA